MFTPQPQLTFTIRAMTAILGATIFTGLAVSPAEASPLSLPSTDQLISLACESELAVVTVIDDAAAVLSSGSALNTTACWYGGAINPRTGELISIDMQELPQPSHLYRLDSTTGALLGTLDFFLDDAPSALWIDSIAYDDQGNLFIFGDDNSLHFASPRPTADQFDLIHLNEAWSLPRAGYAAAFNPVDGKLYALFEDADPWHVFPFDIEYADGVPVGVIMGEPLDSPCSQNCWSLSFDSAGTAWLPIGSDLYSVVFDSATPTYTFQGTLPWESKSITVVRDVTVVTPVPAASAGLATTGTNSEMPVLAAGFLLLLGGLLLSRRRTQTR